MVWMVFIAAAAVMLRWEHTGVTTIVDIMPPMIRAYLIMFSRCATLLFLAYLCVQGIEVVAQGISLNSRTMGFSTKWIKLSIPVGAGLMILFTLLNIIDDLSAIRKGDLGRFKEHLTSTID